MSALRTLRQLTASSARALSTRQAASVSRARLPAFTARVSLTPTVSRTFSISARSLGEGTSDIALSAKLQEELKYEKEAAAEVVGTPEFLKAFQEQGIWQIEDTPGNDEITLFRKFGNENLRLMFSIADMQSEDDAYGNQETEGEESAEDETIHSFPIRASLSITKTNGPGALNIDMVCQEGHFIVDNIAFYGNAKTATELTADADWSRRGLYIGPQFDTLDVAVQEEFERFLQERGVNESVALFLPEYSEFKEQTEYVKWLKNVQTFIDL